MISVRVKKGYRIKIAGRPSSDIEHLSKPARVAAAPGMLPNVKPRLAVAVDDHVKVGSLLYVDKRNPRVRFLSPGAGIIEQINFGPRRTIQEIVIRLDDEEDVESFPTVSENSLQAATREHLIEMLTTGGLWPLLRELPFREIPDPQAAPPQIIVTLGSQEPFHPLPEVYLNGNIDLFAFGIRILQKLAGNAPVLIASNRQYQFVMKELKDLLSHVVDGHYPADDAGVLLYQIKKSPNQNRAWYIDGQDVLMIARLAKYGRYPTERMMVVAGSAADHTGHFHTRLGVPLKHLARQLHENIPVRAVCGGIFRGIQAPADTYMGLCECSLLLLPEGNVREFMALVKPGYQKPSYSRAFLSVMNPAELLYDCCLHGEERACIACMHCADVCPVDILPQMTYKAILVGEVEEYLEHGLLDCVECGLCSYVCPAKIELTAVLKSARASYARELK